MYNFILLLEENSHSNTFSLVEQKPSHVPIPSIEIIQSLCFSQKFQKNNEKRNIVYMFNTEEHYCYTYSFVFSNKRYSIVILSSYFKPNLFLKFLEAVSDSFNEIDILNNVNDNSKIENNKLCECSSDDFIIIINQNDDDNSNISPNFTQNSQNSEYSNSNNDLYNNKKNDNTSGFESDSLCRFGLVVSLLAAWSTNDEGNLIVNFPFSSFSFDLSEIKSWASTYSASILYPYVDQAWQALISNSGILIVSPDPRIASCAVSALLSLIEPLIYEDNVLFFTQRNDPRLAFLFKEQTKTTNIENENNSNLNENNSNLNENNSNLNENNSNLNENNSNLNENNSTGSDCFIPKRKLLDYDVVAVDDELVAEKIKQDFGLVIHINVLNNDNSVTVRDVYSNKTLRLFRVFMAIMNMKLLTDPYFDILQREMSAQEIEETFPNELPQELYEPFQKTKTFQKWRYRKVDREQLRQAFLSVSPKESVSKLKTVEDLLLAEKELNIILKKFSRDLHIETVIKSNLSLIKKKLKKLRK